MTLEQFLDAPDAAERSLVVVNRSVPDPIQSMLEGVFADQPIDVAEESLPEADSDTVLLVEGGDDQAEVIASSPLSALQETILLVNSDLYKTGTRGLSESDLPAVLVELDDVPFRLRGYPESNSEKLLMIAISRYIERRAWSADAGTLRASFQRLSRIDDERGTRRVYDALADSGVQTHVYGVPDWQPAAELDLVAHAGHSPDFRDAWFVVYTPPSSAEASDGNATTSPAADRTNGAVGLLAIEVEPRIWDGFWTFDPALVSEIDRYIAHNL